VRCCLRFLGMTSCLTFIFCSSSDVVEICLRIRNTHMFDPAFTTWNCQFVALCVSAVIPKRIVTAACLYARDVIVYHFRNANVCRCKHTQYHIKLSCIITPFRFSSAIKLGQRCAEVLNDNDAIAGMGFASLLSGTLAKVILTRIVILVVFQSLCRCNDTIATALRQL